MGTGHRRGQLGEDLATRLLQAGGWTILGRNWRDGSREIDIVAAHEGILAFVEVKTRGCTDFGDPLEAITPRKRQEVERAAGAWLRSNGSALRPRSGFPSITFGVVRFDAVAVTLRPGRPPEIVHVEDAWRLDDP